jgi:hypothetical protein
MSDEDPNCDTASLRRETRWAVSGGNVTVIAEPEPSGWAICEPYPLTEDFATVVVIGLDNGDEDSGTLVVIPQAVDVLQVESYAIQHIEQGEDELSVLATSEDETRKVILCVRGTPSESYEELHQEAEQTISAANQ